MNIISAGGVLLYLSSSVHLALSFDSCVIWMKSLLCPSSAHQLPTWIVSGLLLGFCPPSVGNNSPPKHFFLVNYCLTSVDLEEKDNSAFMHDQVF